MFMRFIHSLDVGFSVNKTSSKLSGQATWEALQIVQCTWELKCSRLWCHNTHCTLDCSTQSCEHTPVKQHQAWTWISQQRTNNDINGKLSIKDHHQQQHNHQRKEFKEDDYNCRPLSCFRRFSIFRVEVIPCDVWGHVTLSLLLCQALLFAL